MDVLKHPLIEPGRLLLGPCPGRARPYLETALEEDLGALRAQGAGRVVCLLPDEELERLGVTDLFEALHTGGFVAHHHPIADGSTPCDEEVLLELMGTLEAALANGEAIAIFCRAGLGRTGTVAAAMLVTRGLPPAEAIALVRKARPGTVENDRQRAYLHQLAQVVNG